MMSKTIEPVTFTIPLSFAAHDIAQQYAQLSGPKKFKQAYLNTLAVYAVDYYLRLMGFETNWEHSDSRDSVMLKFLDVADLDVVGIGKIECRPVLPDAGNCHIPFDVWDDRICYVAVQLNQSLQAATLLGFTQTAAAEIPLTNLRKFDNFLEYLNDRRQTATANTKSDRPQFINLKQWFDGVFEETWLTVEQLFNPQKVELIRFKNVVPIVRGQQIDLGMELAGAAVALIVTLPPKSDSEVEVTLQVHPIGDSVYLPKGVKLMVQDESAETVLIDAEARDADNFIQLKIDSVESGECFKVTVALGAASVTEKFCF
ncbi:DUF1822 family protein [Microcoleus sp. CAWBG58]|uniref:DUF1822 family protein n=1 Tax=Microcoleus sp. CAWBG58 TaxID=2841651 RepID=UPI0025EB862B|nr:DUF1822 family protein [Microcoleus sp. CAWBG58]